MIKSTKHYSMKHIYLSIILNIFIFNNSQSQSCLSGGITFSSQNQIDQFSTQYPNCTQINGTVLIIETYHGEIQSLDGLSQLTHIDGDLRIANNGELVNLAGLQNVKSINGSILIFENDSLASLTHLQGIETIKGFLSVGKNEILESLDGLDNIFYAISDLRIFANPLLSNCSLSNLCTYLSNGGNHTISGNALGCVNSQDISSICLASDPCSKPIIQINIDPISSGLYQAINEVKSAGKVSNNRQVDFRAGNCIVLERGFSVGRSTIFSAEINSCGL